MINPPDLVWESHLVIPVTAADHDDPNLVPVVGVCVLNPDMVVNAQSAKGTYILIVLAFHLASTCCSSMVIVFCTFLPFLSEGRRDGRDTRMERVAI